MTYKQDYNRVASIRPVVAKAIVATDTNAQEAFQNSTLRPIIKMQHALLILHYKNYLAQKKCLFADWSQEKRADFIERSLLKDNHLKNELKGMIIGHFTMEEYKTSINIGQEVNKRIINIIKERLLTNLDELLA